MRQFRLLTDSDERGAAPVESVFAMIFLLVCALGVIEVALTLYARNVVLASLHEGARAAQEMGVSSASVGPVARNVISRAAGTLASDIEVSVGAAEVDGRRVVEIDLKANVVPPGPVPFTLPVHTTAVVPKETRP